MLQCKCAKNMWFIIFHNAIYEEAHLHIIHSRSYIHSGISSIYFVKMVAINIANVINLLAAMFNATITQVR